MKRWTWWILAVLSGLLVLAFGTALWIMPMAVLEIGITLAVIAILVIVIILLLANLRAYFTKIALGTTLFISVGDNLKRILPNIGGYKMSDCDDLDGRHWLVPTMGNNEEEKKKDWTKSFFYGSLHGTMWLQRWLWKRLGVRFISFFWPQVHVQQIDIRKGGRRRIEARAAVGSDALLRSRIVDSPEPSTVVNSLLFVVPRPIYQEGVELAGDNSKINLLLLPVFRQVIPVLPVYYLKGDFFSSLDAVVEAAMVDFFASHRVAVYKGYDEKDEKKGQFAKDTYDPPEDATEKTEYEKEYEASPLTYAHWLKLTKAGEGTPMEQKLRHLNVSRDYLAKLEAKEEKEEGGGRKELSDYIKEHLTPKGPVGKPGSETITGLIPQGMVSRFGFALVSFRVIEWEAHSSTKPLAEALLAKETEFHTAEGVRQKAAGERDAIKKLAEAQSGRYQQLVSAFIEQGVAPDVAARVVETLLRTENIRDGKVTTYVEGGGTKTSVMVSASPPSGSPTK